MICSSRPPAKIGPDQPIKVPNREWSPAERRFLLAAIKAADAMRDWWLEKEAKRLEEEAKDDD
jgi:hypothetical protein